MRLYLMRHATAVPRGTPGYLQDSRRPLTDAGRAEARAVAQGLRRLKVGVELIATSPYVRAVQTAGEVAPVLGVKAPVRELDVLRAEVEPPETSRALQLFGQIDAALLVGHEPHLSSWIAWLIAKSGTRGVVVKKAGVACVEVERVPPAQGSGTLRWLLTPKQLTLIGKTP